MALPVYSQKFVDQLYPSPVNMNVGGPSSGFVWVVRDIALAKTSGPGAAAFESPPIVRVEPSGAWLLSPDQSEFHAFKVYRWHGHQVLVPGDQLQVTTYGNAYSVRISGYNLSSP